MATARWRSAAQSAAAAFWPNYRQIQKSRRGLGFVSFTRVIAGIYVVGASLFAITSAISAFGASIVTLTVPVQEFWPGLPENAQITSGPTAHVIAGGFSNASVAVTGLDGFARTWLAASIVLQGAATVVVAIVVMTLCTTVLRDNPFRPVVSLAIRITGLAVMIGGLGWQICSAVAGGLASHQLLQLGSTKISGPVKWDDINTVFGFPMPSFAFQIDFWPLWVGLALLALSLVFRHGIRLQRDTAGLV